MNNRKTNNPHGRPKEHDERKTITLSLRPATIAGLDMQAKEAETSRNQLISNFIMLTGLMQEMGYLRVNKGGSVSWIIVPNPDFIKNQVLSGQWDELRKLDGGEPGAFTLGTPKQMEIFNDGSND